MMNHLKLESQEGVPELLRWLDSLREDDRSASTLEEYARDVRDFWTWLETSAPGLTPNLRVISITTARDYRQHLMARRLSPFTVNRKLGTLAQFLEWLDLPESQNPFRRLKRVEIERVAPKALTRNEWNALRRAAETSVAKDGGLSLAVVSLCRHAGLRAGEVAALSAADIELRDRSGRVVVRQGKGMKHRVVPLVLEAREGLEPWLATRAQSIDRMVAQCRDKGNSMPFWAERERGSLVFGQRGSLTTRGIHHITERLAKMAGIEGPLGPHTLRHTFAKSALDPKAYGLQRDPLPLPALQQALGHSRIDTTSVYTKFSDEEIATLLEERGI